RPWGTVAVYEIIGVTAVPAASGPGIVHETTWVLPAGATYPSEVRLPAAPHAMLYGPPTVMSSQSQPFGKASHTTMFSAEKSAPDALAIGRVKVTSSPPATVVAEAVFSRVSAGGRIEKSTSSRSANGVPSVSS